VFDKARGCAASLLLYTTIGSFIHMHLSDSSLLFATMDSSCNHLKLCTPGAAYGGDVSACLQPETWFARGLLADAA